MDWATFGTVVSTFGTVGGFTFVARMWQRRRTPSRRRHETAQTDSLTATAYTNLVKPLTDARIAAEAETLKRDKRIQVLKSLLRRLAAYIADVHDDTTERHQTIVAMPPELRSDLNRELE